MNFIRREINEVLTFYSIRTLLTWTQLFKHSWKIMQLKYGLINGFSMWGVWFCVSISWSIAPLSFVINRNSKFSIYIQPIVYFLIIVVEHFLTFIFYKIGVQIIDRMINDVLIRRLYYHTACNLDSEIVQKFEDIIANENIDSLYQSKYQNHSIFVETQFLFNSMTKPKQYLIKTRK